MSIALLLLAAGSSSRLGQPKQLLPYHGRTLLRHAAEVAAATACHPRLLVTGALHDELLPEVANLDFAAIRNAGWAAGLGGSIAAGMRALDAVAPAPAGVLVMLCDQPLLTPAVLHALLAQFRATAAPVVACEYGGVRGVPAVFGPAALAALRALAGPAGARDLLRQYQHLPAVPFAGGATDVDTAAQYAALP